MSKRPRRKLYTAILRLVLGLIFIAIVLRGVTWNDRVYLRGEDEEVVAVRLLEEDAESVTIRNPAGEAERLSRERIARDEQGDERIERGLVYAWRHTHKRYLALAFLIFLPVPLMQSWRLKVLLGAQDIHITFWDALKLSVGGNFLNFVFLLGTTAGDVFKAYYTAQHTPHKTEAVATIILDRFVGLAGLLILAGGMSLLGTDSAMLRRMGLAAFALLAGLLVAALVMAHPGVMRLLEHNRLSGLLGISHLQRFQKSVERLVKRRAVLGLATGLAVALQFVAVGAGVMCAYALQMNFADDRVRDYFVYIGAGHLVAAVPITPQGLGTMELAYQQFFLGTYGTLPQLLCLALWVRLLQLFWSLPGALVTMLGAHRPKDIAMEEIEVSSS
jgi:uncharacterized protein (TIRG00374 family)